jgi:hypothetical protein
VGPEVVERMIALVRWLSDKDLSQGPMVTEARAIVALLPEPVDADEAEAIDQLSHSFVPQTDEARALALRCIKRGRELASMETLR